MKSLRFWIGIVMSLICLYVALQGIQLAKLLQALQEFNYFWLFPASLIFLISYVARVFRWQLLFAPQKVHWRNVFHTLNIGYLLSNLLPARLGDLVRAYLIGELEGASKARALSTVVVERLSDGLAAVLLLAITALFVPNIPDVAKQGALSVALGGIAGILFLVLLSFQKDEGLALLHRLTPPIPILHSPRLWGALEALIDGFAILRSPRSLIGVAGWALVAWITGGMLYWIIMIGINLRTHGTLLPIQAAFLVMTITSLAVVVPSSPGYVGVFHFGAQVTLNTVFGVDKAAALSYAFVIHGFTYIWLILLGIYSMWHTGLTYERLQQIQSLSQGESS